MLHWCLPKHSATIWHQAESLLINMYRITFLAHFFEITSCIVVVFQILLPLEPVCQTHSANNIFTEFRDVLESYDSKECFQWFIQVWSRLCHMGCCWLNLQILLHMQQNTKASQEQVNFINLNHLFPLIKTMLLLFYLQNSSWYIMIFSPNISLYYHRDPNFSSSLAKLSNSSCKPRTSQNIFHLRNLVSGGYFIKHKEQILLVVVSHWAQSKRLIAVS